MLFARNGDDNMSMIDNNDKGRQEMIHFVTLEVSLRRKPVISWHLFTIGICEIILQPTSFVNTVIEEKRFQEVLRCHEVLLEIIHYVMWPQKNTSMQ